jgi:hypothetical protein
VQLEQRPLPDAIGEVWIGVHSPRSDFIFAKRLSFCLRPVSRSLDETLSIGTNVLLLGSSGGAHHQAVQLVSVRLNMRQNIFDRYRTFSRGGSYQWMSEQGSNAKDRNHL